MASTRALVTAATDLCAQRGWPMLEDRSEQVTGLGIAVLRVLAGGVPAALRLGVTGVQVAAYQALAPSGLTPAVVEAGMHAGHRWILLTWVPGVPFDSSVLGDREEFLAAAVEVAAGARGLYVTPAPPDARDVQLRVSGQMEERTMREWSAERLTPAMTRVVEEFWEPAFILHGDLVPSNTLRLPDGSLRFIDPEGGIGPIERDAAWLAVGGVFMAASRAPSLTALRREADALVSGLAGQVPHLREDALRAWTAHDLVTFAHAQVPSGMPVGQARALVAVGGSLFPDASMPVTVDRGLNAPCACGSGRKAKRCCLADRR